MTRIESVPVSGFRILYPNSIRQVRPIKMAVYGTYDPGLFELVTGLSNVQFDRLRLEGVGLRFQDWSKMPAAAQAAIAKRWQGRKFAGGFSLEHDPVESTAVYIATIAPGLRRKAIKRLRHFNLHGDWYEIARLETKNGPIYAEVIKPPAKLIRISKFFPLSSRIVRHRIAVEQSAKEAQNFLNSL